MKTASEKSLKEIPVIERKPSISSEMILPKPMKPGALSIMGGITAMAAGVAVQPTPPLPTVNVSNQYNTSSHNLTRPISNISRRPSISEPLQKSTDLIESNLPKVEPISSESYAPPNPLIKVSAEVDVAHNYLYKQPTIIEPTTVLNEHQKRSKENGQDDDLNRNNKIISITNTTLDNSKAVSKTKLEDRGKEGVISRTTSEKSFGSSGEDSLREGYKPGRRKSIVRQESYDEENEKQSDTSTLQLLGNYFY